MEGSITTDKPKSWRTTACGILGIIGILCTSAVALLDNDPNTSVDLASILQIVGPLLAAIGLGGIGVLSKDHKVHG